MCDRTQNNLSESKNYINATHETHFYHMRIMYMLNPTTFVTFSMSFESYEIPSNALYSIRSAPRRMQGTKINHKKCWERCHT